MFLTMTFDEKLSFVLVSHYDRHIFTFILIQRLRYPRGALQFFSYIPGDIWTIQDLTVALTFKDHCSASH